MILCANIVLTFFFILFLVTFKEKPTYPPSEIALQEPQKRDFIGSFRELRENKNFVIIAVYYMLTFGLYTSFGNLQCQILQPYGLEVTQIAIIGCVTLTAGIISALNFGKLLDRTKKYRLFLICLPIAHFAGLAWFVYFSLPNANSLKANLLLNSIFFGASIVPVIPLCMSFSVEVTFPVQASTSNGVIILLANLGAFSLSILGTFISQKDFKLHPEFD